MTFNSLLATCYFYYHCDCFICPFAAGPKLWGSEFPAALEAQSAMDSSALVQLLDVPPHLMLATMLSWEVEWILQFYLCVRLGCCLFFVVSSFLWGFQSYLWLFLLQIFFKPDWGEIKIKVFFSPIYDFSPVYRKDAPVRKSFMCH